MYTFIKDLYSIYVQKYVYIYVLYPHMYNPI